MHDYHFVHVGYVLATQTYETLMLPWSFTIRLDFLAINRTTYVPSRLLLL